MFFSISFSSHSRILLYFRIYEKQRQFNHAHESHYAQILFLLSWLGWKLILCFAEFTARVRVVTGRAGGGGEGNEAVRSQELVCGGRVFVPAGLKGSK